MSRHDLMSAPIVFKRNKSKLVQRSRQTSPDATNHAELEITEDESPSALAAKLKKRAKARSKLSFGDEGEEEEIFQVKKSSLSRKLAAGKRHASIGGIIPSSLDPASITPRSNGSPVYNEAYLSELKASTPTSRQPIPRDDAYDMDMSVDLDEFPMSGMTDDLEPVIPSESSILASKQKRERIRGVARTSEEDYISLTVIKRDEEYRGPHPESRLVREADELGEGDDEFAEYTSAQERIALGRKSKRLEAEKQLEVKREMMADAEEEDEESIQWEQEQMRRGGHVRDAVAEQQTKPTYTAAPIPPATPIPILGSVVTRLSKSLSDLTISHARTTSSLSSISDERMQLEARQANLRAMISKAETKRSWFAAFREWMETVAVFLDEKYPLLEKVEKQHISFIKERSGMITSRRRADDTDDLALIFGDLPTLLNGPEELDELGRVVPTSNPAVARRERLAARVARRSRRKINLSSTGDSEAEAEEGYSTDSSLPPSDAMDYSTAVNAAIADGKAILADVHAVAFKEPSQGLGKWFEEWRSQYKNDYSSAFGGMGLVASWEFWVRLEMVAWNPFDELKRLDTFAWYRSLHRYASRPGPEDAQPRKLGSEEDLVSAMVSTTVVPRLCKIIEVGAFDPFSAKAVKKIIDIAKEVEGFVAVDHVKYSMLLKCVQSRFQQAVTETEDLVSQYRVLENRQFEPEAIPATQRFLTRRMKLIQNILRWREHTGEKFGLGGLATRTVSKSVLPVADTGWEVGGEYCVRKIVDLLPPDLTQPSLLVRLRM